MANGFKVFSVSEVLTAADVNDYLMEQSIAIFSNSTTRDAQISSPVDGQACFLLDSNVLQFYFSSAWNNFVGEGDITGVTAGTGLDGGGTTGAVTINFDPNSLSAGTVNVANDSITIIDADDSNNPKKEAIADFVSAIAGTNLTASSGQLNAGGGTAFSIIDTFNLSGDLSGTGFITSFTDTANSNGAITNLGSSMSESSGEFTFPETGLYLVEAWARIDYTANSQISINIQATTNNSSYNTIALSRTNAGAQDDAVGQYPYCSVYVDVTDVSNVKIKFSTSGNFNTFSRVRTEGTKFRFTKVAST